MLASFPLRRPPHPIKMGECAVSGSARHDRCQPKGNNNSLAVIEDRECECLFSSHQGVFHMTSIAYVSEAIRTILTERATALERPTDFVERSSARLSGAVFAQTLVFGFLTFPQASYAQLQHVAASLGVSVSRQAVQQRFGPASVLFMRQLLEEAVAQVIQSDGRVPELFSRFSGIYLQDGTEITLPPARAQQYPSSGKESGSDSGLSLGGKAKTAARPCKPRCQKERSGRRTQAISISPAYASRGKRGASGSSRHAPIWPFLSPMACNPPCRSCWPAKQGTGWICRCKWACANACPCVWWPVAFPQSRPEPPRGAPKRWSVRLPKGHAVPTCIVDPCVLSRATGIIMGIGTMLTDAPRANAKTCWDGSSG